MIKLKTVYLSKIIVLIMNETDFFTHLQIFSERELWTKALSTNRSKLHRKKILHVNCDLVTECCLTPCIKPESDLCKKS